jgi:hypothetical protein
MATVDKKIADDIVAGLYADDHPQVIWKYQNAWGGDAYGVIFKGEASDRYAASDFVRNPTLYWSAK